MELVAPAQAGVQALELAALRVLPYLRIRSLLETSNPRLG